MQCLADVEPEEVSWLWRSRIPARKVSILVGDPGDGKTWVAIDLASHVTRGTALPGDEEEVAERMAI